MDTGRTEGGGYGFTPPTLAVYVSTDTLPNPRHQDGKIIHHRPDERQDTGLSDGGGYGGVE